MITKTRRAIIKEELVELTGDFKLAIVLNQMLYWSERKEDAEIFVKEEVERLQKYANHVREEVSINLAESHGWIYKKAEDLSKETMMNVKPKAMREYLKELVANGWLDERRNPKVKMDRTLQYRVNIFKIQVDLQQLGYHLDRYPLPIESSNILKEHSMGEKEKTTGEKETTKGEKEQAIPEITSESTSENLKEKEEEGDSYAKANPFSFFEQNGFGTIGSHLSEKILLWCEDLGDELVEKAMELAVERGAKTFAYVESILRNWAEKGIRTVTEADALLLQHKQHQVQKRGNFPRKKPIRKEKIPKWFGEQPKSVCVSVEEEEKLLLELQEEINSLRR